MKVGRLAAGIILVLLITAAPASARTVVMRAGPYVVGPFETERPKVIVRSPRVDGFITRMHARLVDAKGRQVTIQRVMLHHVVFINQGRFPGDRKSKCGTRFGEPFYGTGEENQSLVLPKGYGYKIRPGDRWKMQTMLMSHQNRVDRVYVEYTMEVTERAQEPVTPYWVRVTDCRNEPSWSISGGGAPGSIALRTNTWKVPADGLIVAGGAHLHGGAHDITLNEPACQDRRLLGSDPSYGTPDDIVYRVRPALHEPGPVNTAWFLSGKGIPVKRGATLRAIAKYDGERPHMGVMGVFHLYVAEGPGAARKARAARECAPLPDDAREVRPSDPHRDDPPAVTIPLTHLVNGRPTTLEHPKGAVKWFSSPMDRPLIDVDRMRFAPVNFSVAAGTTVTWRFDDTVPHKVSLANGPRSVGSPTLADGREYSRRFSVPGVYQLFCYLHPMTMHQELTVRAADGPSSPG